MPALARLSPLRRRPREPSAPIPRSSVAISPANVIHDLSACLALKALPSACKYWARIRSRVDMETSCRLLHRDRHLSPAAVRQAVVANHLPI
ncbi:hypothetical protein U9M48_019911 [Paspalum notatum var. saurae]|uniref:Uncharacterized protein n=1 Tax=Paspalum notatum var. saurae TaxID=547442 RepID=A0AAQ3TEY0_PASNO